MPRTIVAGNWKMHHGPSAARSFLKEFTPPVREGLEVVVFPPAVSLGAAREALGDDAPVRLGAQNVHWRDHGAFTGEISASMAGEYGIAYVLVGHSERRQLFHETDEEVGRKVGAILRADLRPMACVGETLEEREAGRLEEVLRRQLYAVLEGLSGAGTPDDLVLAYEPVWAIGTGRTATPDDASGAHGFLRARLVEELGDEVALSIPLLYGGSVKPENARELMAAPDVDGVLVGGASLDPDSFRSIAEAA